MNALLNRTVALFSIKCPRCYKGNMFVSSNIYSWTKGDLMPDKCSCCGQAMRLETGFYFGAMYISYALYVTIFIPSFMITVIFYLSYLKFLISFIIFIVVTSPYIFRLSRAMYLYIYVRFDPNTKF